MLPIFYPSALNPVNFAALGSYPAASLRSPLQQATAAPFFSIAPGVRHAAETPCLLRTQGLSGQRGERTLFQGLDLSFTPGSVVWLRGRNGRGKTTLLRLLAGLASPLSGEVQIAGRELRQAGPAWRRHWVYIAHQNALKDDLTALEALRFLADLHGLGADLKQLTHALQRLGVARSQHALVRTLSQGQRRRVALARLVLSHACPLWLLDEPFDALDSDGIEALNAVIAEHAAAGGCVVLTSHQPLTLTHPVPTELDLERYAQA